MATHCEICGRPLSDKKNRFCLPHARSTLRKLEAVGYLQPLQISTVDGANQKLSRHRFLTLPDGPVTPAKTSD
jgi:hypothetical protein